VREGARRFEPGPAEQHAACVHIQEGLATDRLQRVPSGPAKATALNEALGKGIDACFGNSIHDLAMLEIARKRFVVNPNPDLEKIARRRGWEIYWPAGTKA